MSKKTISKKEEEMSDDTTEERPISVVLPRDIDKKKFYECSKQSANMMQEGDMMILDGRLLEIKKISKKVVGGEAHRSITLSNGYVFNPDADRFKSITYYRLRRAFREAF